MVTTIDLNTIASRQTYRRCFRMQTNEGRKEWMDEWGKQRCKMIGKRILDDLATTTLREWIYTDSRARVQSQSQRLTYKNLQRMFLI